MMNCWASSRIDSGSTPFLATMLKTPKTTSPAWFNLVQDTGEGRRLFRFISLMLGVGAV